MPKIILSFQLIVSTPEVRVGVVVVVVVVGLFDPLPGLGVYVGLGGIENVLEYVGVKLPYSKVTLRLISLSLGLDTIRHQAVTLFDFNESFTHILVHVATLFGVREKL